MKLWLQVLFAQGYLWRDRFPEAFPDVEHHSWQPELFWVAFGLFFAAGGVLALFYGSAILGPILLVTGVSLAVWSGDSFGLKPHLWSRAFWSSVSWTAGALTTGGFAVLLPFSVFWAIDNPLTFPFPWCYLVGSASYMVLFGSMSLHLLQRRYLFFADPEENASMLQEPEWNPRQLWAETYWYLPRQILFGVEPPRTTGGQA